MSSSTVSVVFTFAILLFFGTLAVQGADVFPPASEDDAVFIEDFTRYSDGWKAKVYKGVYHISPSEKYVRSRGGNLTGDMMGSMAIDWRNRKATAFRFRVRFVEKVHPLSITIKNWGIRVPASPFKRYVLRLDGSTVELKLEGQRTSPKPNPKKPNEVLPVFEYPALPQPVKSPSFVPDRWYDFELQTMEKGIRLFLQEKGKWTCILDAPVAEGTGLPSFDYSDGELDLGPMILSEMN